MHLSEMLREALCLVKSHTDARIVSEEEIFVNDRMYIYEDNADCNDITFIPANFDECDDDILFLTYGELETPELESEIIQTIKNYFGYGE